MRTLDKITFSGLLLSLLFLSCRKEGYKAFTHDPQLYRLTVKKLNNIILENNFPPVTASRNYAYATIAAYEIIAAGDPAHYKSLAGQIRDLGPVPKPSDPGSIDFPLASILAFCRVGNAVTFPEGSMDVYVADLVKKVQEKGIPSAVFNKTSLYADSVATFILKWSKGDHYARTRSESRYAVNQVPGRWTPTPPMYAQATEAHWAEIRPLVLDSAGQIKVPPPPVYNMSDKNSPFYKNTLDVMLTGNKLTENEKHIASFWDDNPFKLNVVGHVMFATKKFSPVGHWMNIVGIGTQNQHFDYNRTVSVYAETSIAIFDSFITCWLSKFTYAYIRPETAINKYLDPDWRPFIQTPPFPEYTSGHAVISAAASTILEKEIGPHTAFRDTSETEFGIAPIRFSSFKEASDQAGRSRVLGGIHFNNSCVVGSEQGRAVGNLVLQRLTLKYNRHK